MEIAIGTFDIHIDTVDSDLHLLRSRQILDWYVKKAVQAKPKHPRFFRTIEVKGQNFRRRNSEQWSKQPAKDIV